MTEYIIQSSDESAYIEALRALFRRVQAFPEGTLMKIPDDAKTLTVGRFWVFWVGEGELDITALSDLVITHSVSYRLDHSIKIEELAGTYGELMIVVRWGHRGS